MTEPTIVADAEQIIEDAQFRRLVLIVVGAGLAVAAGFIAADIVERRRKNG